MKLTISAFQLSAFQLLPRLWRREQTIAVFGMARLVKNGTGAIRLIGGSIEDRRSAREWCSHFLHEAIIEVQPSNRMNRPRAIGRQKTVEVRLSRLAPRIII